MKAPSKRSRPEASGTSPVTGGARVSRFRDWFQDAVGASVVVLCAALVVLFYAALIALVVSVWVAKNDPSVRVAATLFATACFWPLVHALRIGRPRRRRPPARPVYPVQPRDRDAGDRRLDLTALERTEPDVRATR